MKSQNQKFRNLKIDGKNHTERILPAAELDTNRKIKINAYMLTTNYQAIEKSAVCCAPALVLDHFLSFCETNTDG